MRTYQLKCEILRALAQCRGYLLPEPTLFNQLRLVVRPAPLQAEFKEALNELESQQWISGVCSALGGPAKWRLTDLGRSELAQQEL